MAMAGMALLSLITVATCASVVAAATVQLESRRLCSQCPARDPGGRCPPSDAYPHLTAWDGSLVAGALQSDFVPSWDRRIYAVPNIKGGESDRHNAYYGWQSTSGSASGFHRFSNYMDKCSDGQSYLTADEHGAVGLQSLRSLASLADADWKSISPPPALDHRGYRFWLSRSTGKCLTVFASGGSNHRRGVGVAECKFDGSDPFQLFAFRFHYHKAFCCCGIHNE